MIYFSILARAEKCSSSMVSSSKRIFSLGVSIASAAAFLIAPLPRSRRGRNAQLCTKERRAGDMPR
jgi:hypothetical protein